MNEQRASEVVDFLSPCETKDELEAYEWTRRRVAELPEEQAAKWLPVMRQRIGRKAA